MAAPQPAVRSSQPHIHISGLQCPVCDQPIPSEKADQVRARMDAREREVSESVSARLKRQHDALWKKQGTLYRDVQKACGDLCSEIDRIIEAAD
jgi:hypothetical protein